uniref:TIR domain-containing protein n=1 Tax=Pseudonaja textilis TaxID=8673 RepID=A0A670XMY6_PSETE
QNKKVSCSKKEVHILFLIFLIQDLPLVTQSIYKYFTAVTTISDSQNHSAVKINLLEVPTYLPTKLVFLDLSQNSIQSLEKNDFKNFSCLQALNISQNNINKIEDGAFIHTSHLEFLNLSVNQLQFLSSSMFDGLMNLTTLLLARNKISKINPSAFANLENLKVIDLSSNKLYTLNAMHAVFNMGSLRELHIKDNGLANFSTKEITSAPPLLELDISNNPISLINITTPVLQRLFSLDLSFAIAKTILWEIEDPCFLEGLKALYLGGIAMKPSEISKVIQMLNCSQLEIIHLNQLNITESDNLLENICQWHQQVQSLNFQGNMFTNIKAEAFENCTHLKFLNMSFNKLKRLPMASFQSLNLLHSISWTNNIPTLIGFVSSHYFDNLNNFLNKLEVLVLRQNNLKTIEKGIFKNLSSLQVLNLADNRIDTIAPGAFEGLSNLQILILGHNRIGKKTFRADFFQGASSLQLSTLPSLFFLDLRQNNFICTCSNQMFIQWSLQNPKTQVLHFYQYTCAFPQTYKGKPLWTFNTSSCFIDYEFILFIANATAVLSLMLICFFYQWKFHMVYMFHLLLAYYIDKKQKRKGQGAGYEYDAFLSYNTHDEKWVEDNLLPVLEKQYNWKVCLHHRDFEPGRSIIENIVDNIYSSRKTICIISRHYLESEWCSKEIQVASFRIFDDHKDVLVLIFLEDIPAEYLSPYHRMRKLLKTKTYLKWPEDEREIPFPWRMATIEAKISVVKRNIC